MTADPAPSAGRVIDLSHRIRPGMVTYPGLPGPEISPHLTRVASRQRYAPGTEFTIDRISMVGNTGTYLDAPFHRYGDGTDLAGLALEGLVDVPAEVVHSANGPDGRGIEPAALAGRELTGRAVLLHTGWDAYFGTPEYGVGAPFLTEAAAEHLVRARVAVVGIDSVNIDDIEGGIGPRPAHSVLLAAGIPIVEHLTRLDRLPSSGSRFSAIPPAIEGFGTVTVRAVAVVQVAVEG